jgi:hypothetical protein
MSGWAMQSSNFLEKYGTTMLERYVQDDLAALKDGEWIDDDDVDDDMDGDYAEGLGFAESEIEPSGSNAMKLAIFCQKLIARLSSDDI